MTFTWQNAGSNFILTSGGLKGKLNHKVEFETDIYLKATYFTAQKNIPVEFGLAFSHMHAEMMVKTLKQNHLNYLQTIAYLPFWKQISC